MPIAGAAKAYMVGSTPATAVYLGATKVWPTAPPPTSPTPTLTSITPTSMWVEDPPQRLTCNGTNFEAGLVVYLLPPGGSWQAPRPATITSATQAYVENVDLSAGAWKVMVGYDSPTVTRSGQLPLTVNNRVPAIYSVSPTSVARGQIFDMVVTGWGLAGTQTITMGIDTVDGNGYWVTAASNETVTLTGHYFGAFSTLGVYDIACRIGDYSGAIVAQKADCITLTA